MREIDYSYLPLHTQEATRAYIEEGLEPGDFLQAVLENNLVKSFGRADDTNVKHMRHWVMWLYNECPGSAWGSKEIVNKWMLDRQKESKDEQVDDDRSREPEKQSEVP